MVWSDSQFFANLYLDRLDHFIKERLRCRAYLRYVDDFVLFADSKPRQHAKILRMVGDQEEVQRPVQLRLGTPGRAHPLALAKR